VTQSLITQGYAPDDLIITKGLWFGENLIMTTQIPLIDKADTFELVRDRVASILAAETQFQQQKAAAIGKDPEPWKFRVYSERSNPWENLFGDDRTPVVNVMYSRSDEAPENPNKSPWTGMRSTYYIDCYCYAESYQTSDGHRSGDELSARLAHNTAKLIRNLLMHPSYAYLLYQPRPNSMMDVAVGRRSISHIEAFQPMSGNMAVEKVIAAHMTLEVDHNETVPIQEYDTLEEINVKFYCQSDGEVTAELNYDAS
jgi:hypothetical protein